MLHIVKTSKNVNSAATDLEEAVKRNGFGVMHVYDLKEKLKEKMIDFPNQCKILEVCNPKQAAGILAEDMSVCLALPCRIAVYEQEGVTLIGTILPSAMLRMFPGAKILEEKAYEVEMALIKMIEEAMGE